MEGFILSRLQTIIVIQSQTEECVHLILYAQNVVALLKSSCQIGDVTLFSVQILDPMFSILARFNWQTVQGQWRATNPIFFNNNIYDITPSINFRSELEDIGFFMNGPRFFETAVNNFQKRVIYLGYWLSDSNISTLVQNWKSSNITHIILTFILYDEKTGLYADTSMIPAFQALTPANQKLLTDNFVVGISLGGAAGWPSPISLVYTQGKYKNNPDLFESDLLALLPKYPNGSYCFDYIDFDLENLEPNIDVQQFSDFFGSVATSLKRDIPNVLISHAPQTPYFTSDYNNVYTAFYTAYQSVIDWFNIQYYNNGSSNTFEEIFLNSDNTRYPGVAVLQLIQKGIPPHVIVVGKPVNAQEGSSGGYVPLNPIQESTTLSSFVQQAFQTESLSGWASEGGVMIWYFNTQVALGSGPYLNNYIQTVYNPQPPTTANTDNEEILTFYSAISSL